MNGLINHCCAASSRTFLFWTYTSTSFLWTNRMHKCTEGKCCYYESKRNSQWNDLAELVEEWEATGQQEYSTTDGGHVPTENTCAHLSVCLLHFQWSCLFSRVNVIGREVDNVVNWETDKNHNGDWFDDSKLLAVRLHYRRDTYDDKCNTENWNWSLNYISSCY